jgi:hypothetical protein
MAQYANSQIPDSVLSGMISNPLLSEHSMSQMSSAPVSQPAIPVGPVMPTGPVGPARPTAAPPQLVPNVMSQLPPHMLMNSQNPAPQMNNVGSASVNMPIQQKGGKKIKKNKKSKDFFFLMADEMTEER